MPLPRRGTVEYEEWKASPRYSQWLANRPKNVRPSLDSLNARVQTFRSKHASTPCQICGGHERVRFVDHNHRTGRLRGMLCNTCNVALGFFRTDARRLLRSIVYLAETDDTVEARRILGWRSS